MTPAQWQRVKELFEAALDHLPTERAAFVAAACEDDEVRAEVESLLLAHERDSTFMNEPVGSLLPVDKPILAAGQPFGHYEQISLLRKGGMGQVYAAIDNRLGRKVALKLLPSSLTHDPAYVNRLAVEARAASALNHPNIITIHDIGEIESIHFMATEFVQGKTLREHLSERQLSLAEVVDVATQVGSALQAAHESAIVHRDVKPENIMVRPDGVVKVLDFGLATLPQHRVETNDLTALSRFETKPGLIAGTVAYMSPEQTRGNQVDTRTDVWSFGVLLYEMISGRTPFNGDTPNDVMLAIREREPPNLDAVAIPRDLLRIVTKALSKNPDQRYADAGAMVSDLKSVKESLAYRGHRPFVVAMVGLVIALLTLLTYTALRRNKTNTSLSATTRSIAVLPFTPVAAAQRDEIFETGMADVVIQRLSSMPGFAVRSLNATSSYRDGTRDAIAAGKEQQVDYVISTSYQMEVGKIHIAAELISVSTGQVEQTYKFDTESADLFAAQDTIANEIGNRLQAQFATAPVRRMAKRGTSNREAYRLYLQGMYLANNRNLDNARTAVSLLERAVALDPNYARAWAGLAYAHRTLSLYTASLSTHETYQKSIAAINRALALDPNLSDAHSALCENKFLYEWDFPAAEAECKRAIELDASSSQAHEIYSRYLMGRGRHDEAINEIETAIDLEPTSRFNQRNYGRALFYARRYPEAATQLKRVLAMDENFVNTYAWLVSALALQGNETEAFDWLLKLLAHRKIDEQTIGIFKKAFQTSGWRGVLREWVKRIDDIGGGAFERALYHAQIGNADEAFKHLEQSYERREIWMTYLRVDPRLDSLRQDPRFIDLVGRVESTATKKT